MKTYADLREDLHLESITSMLFKAARLSADIRAVKKSAEKGSMSPIEKRLYRKLVGRTLVRSIFSIVK